MLKDDEECDQLQSSGQGVFFSAEETARTKQSKEQLDELVEWRMSLHLGRWEAPLLSLPQYPGAPSRADLPLASPSVDH